MEATIFEYLTTQGIFAVLFAGLLFYLLRMTKRREDYYRERSQEINETLKRIEDLLEEIIKR